MAGSGSEKENVLPASLLSLMVLDRVTLDTSILVGPRSLEFAIAARLGYHRGHWSNWNDHPIMQTAIVAGVPGVLVTDNRRNFPTGDARNGILIVSGRMFLDYLYQTYPEAEAVITRYAERRRQAMREGR